jgi:hypothetical protein
MIFDKGKVTSLHSVIIIISRESIEQESQYGYAHVQ